VQLCRVLHTACRYPGRIRTGDKAQPAYGRLSLSACRRGRSQIMHKNNPFKINSQNHIPIDIPVLEARSFLAMADSIVGDVRLVALGPRGFAAPAGAPLRAAFGRRPARRAGASRLAARGSLQPLVGRGDSPASFRADVPPARKRHRLRRLSLAPRPHRLALCHQYIDLPQLTLTHNSDCRHISDEVGPRHF